MAGTGLAALPTAQVPEVGAAAVTALSLHVGQAVALPAALVALALLWPAGVGVGAQCVAGATPAAVPHGIPIVPRLALGTVWPCRVVEASQALPRAPVTRLWVSRIDVIVALAGPAVPAGLQRVPVVPGRTLVTAGTCVPGAAVADNLPGAPILVAGGSKVPGATGSVGAGAGPAVLAGAQRRVPKVPGRTPLAPLAVRVVAAAQAAARLWVALLGVPVALAGPAGGEAPVARLAAVAA